MTRPRLRQMAAFIALVALTPLAFAADDRLVLTGSSTMAPLALEIGKRFEQRNPGVRVDVQAGGSSRGIADTRAGLADIGMVSRALRRQENDLVPYAIALDGVGIILHRDNPVASLSDGQIRAIYTGRIANWREVGGRDVPVTVVNKAEGRATLEVFLRHFGLKNSAVEPDVVIGDNQQGIKTVAGNPGAIGYVSIGTAGFEAARGTPVKLLPLEGIAASVENLRDGSFPASRPLNLVTRTAPPPLARRFIDFAQSEATDDIVRGQYFIPPGR